MRGRTVRTAKNRKAVLDALTHGWSVHGAARKAGISTRSYYDWRDADDAFRADADAALEAATDHLEDVARNRAIHHSDLLLIFLLRARRPTIYNRKTVISGDIDNPLVVDHLHHDAGEPWVIMMPENGRDKPDHEALTIEDQADDKAT